jgi:hypothetical protein
MELKMRRHVLPAHCGLLIAGASDAALKGCAT